MKSVEAWQKKKIYAIANKLNFVAKGEQDILHMIIENLTGKESVTKLTFDEAQEMIDYLAQQQMLAEKKQGVTEQQKKKIWALMYELKNKDMVLNVTPVGERLAGIIKKEFHVISSPQRLFSQLEYADGQTLIEKLKNYIRNAERKRRC